MKDVKKVRVNVYNRGNKKRPNYWVRFSYPGYADNPVRLPSNCKVRSEADGWAAELERKIHKGEWTPTQHEADKADPGKRLTFGTYSLPVLAERVKAGVKTANDDERGHLNNHLIPEFGDEPIEEAARFQRKCDGFKRISEKLARDGQPLSGSTVRNIEATYQAVMRKAAKAGHIRDVPARLNALEGEIPFVRDKRPEGWREQAVFNREEIATLARSEHIELQYRVMIVLWFLTGPRFAELCALTVRGFDPDCKPLPSITIRAVKTRRDRNTMYRVLPVPPTLGAWLSWWLREGFELVHGRAPRPEDLMFPSLSTRRRLEAKRAGVDPLTVPVSHGEFYKRWMRHHLPKSGLAHRRVHDTRRTFISILRSAGVDKDWVRKLTHRSVADTVMDAYTTLEWEQLCNAIGCVDWRLPGPPGSQAVVIQLGRRLGRERR